MLKQIGTQFGMEKYSAISSIIESLKDRMQDNRKLKNCIDELTLMAINGQRQT